MSRPVLLVNVSSWIFCKPAFRFDFRSLSSTSPRPSSHRRQNPSKHQFRSISTPLNSNLTASLRPHFEKKRVRFTIVSLLSAPALTWRCVVILTRTVVKRVHRRFAVINDLLVYTRLLFRPRYHFANGFPGLHYVIIAQKCTPLANCRGSNRCRRDGGRVVDSGQIFRLNLAGPARLDWTQLRRKSGRPRQGSGWSVIDGRTGGRRLFFKLWK
jgi:hypothetical protein